MARYINADKVIEIIRNIAKTSWQWMPLSEIERSIAEQPAFDTDLKVDDAAVVDRKAVVNLISQALKDNWKDYDPRLESFAEGLIEKIKKMDGPLDQSLRAAEPAHIEEPRTYPVHEIKPEDISEANYIDHLIDDMMEKWREHGGKHLKIVITYGGKEIEQIEIS